MVELSTIATVGSSAVTGRSRTQTRGGRFASVAQRGSTVHREVAIGSAGAVLDSMVLHSGQDWASSVELGSAMRETKEQKGRGSLGRAKGPAAALAARWVGSEKGATGSASDVAALLCASRGHSEQHSEGASFPSTASSCASATPQLAGPSSDAAPRPVACFCTTFRLP